ncbi:hypothetical protein NM688_g8756 [Phlebia brevispora]|uniref:Uncharacterized protein n=1 Tax=Phlebia brevispora TaxID=194682 RepID=A0ACC1RQW7_9APHY|nr:hypothetical protein NM688_g8756 [Phlebia brevispora]
MPSLSALEMISSQTSPASSSATFLQSAGASTSKVAPPGPSTSSIASPTPSLSPYIPSSSIIAPSAVSSSPSWSLETNIASLQSRSGGSGTWNTGNTESDQGFASTSRLSEYTTLDHLEPSPSGSSSTVTGIRTLSEPNAPSSSLLYQQPTSSGIATSLSESAERERSSTHHTMDKASVATLTPSQASTSSLRATYSSLRKSGTKGSHTAVAIEALPSVNITESLEPSNFVATTQVVTTTFRTTYATSSGTATPWQVVDVTQTSVRTIVTPVGSATNKYSVMATGNVATDTKHGYVWDCNLCA